MRRAGRLGNIGGAVFFQTGESELIQRGDGDTIAISAVLFDLHLVPVARTAARSGTTLGATPPSRITPGTRASGRIEARIGSRS